VTVSGTAVICCYTLDRWDRLVDAVASVRAQQPPVDAVVVVDHNEALLTAAQEAFPDLVVVPNGEGRGLSGARNTGVACSDTDVVLFLDDDAVAEPSWAASLLACFADPRVMVVGGRVDPDWEGGARPRWFPAEFGWVVGCSYTGQPERLGTVRNPIGASMAIRRDVFAAVGGFSGALGRVGSLPVGCEETELCIRLLRRDPEVVVLHQPDSRVTHAVPEQRQTPRYFLSRCFHEGRSKAAVTRRHGSGSSLGSEARYVRRVLPLALWRYAVAALRGAPAPGPAVREEPTAAPGAASGRRLAALGAALFVVLGLALVTTGFVVEHVTAAVTRRDREPAYELVRRAPAPPAGVPTR